MTPNATTRTSMGKNPVTTENTTEEELLRAARWQLLHAAIVAAKSGDQGAATFVHAYCALRQPVPA